MRWSSVGSPRRVSSGLEIFSDFGVNNDNCNPALLVKKAEHEPDMAGCLNILEGNCLPMLDLGTIKLLMSR